MNVAPIAADSGGQPCAPTDSRFTPAARYPAGEPHSIVPGFASIVISASAASDSRPLTPSSSFPISAGEKSSSLRKLRLRRLKAMAIVLVLMCMNRGTEGSDGSF